MSKLYFWLADERLPNKVSVLSLSGRYAVEEDISIDSEPLIV